MKPSLNLGISVVIPAYKEEFLLLSLMSLKKCLLPTCDVEIIVVINSSEADGPATKKLNREIYHTALNWSRKNYRLRMRFHILMHEDLPKRHAGVGLARKIGMDEAVYRFERIRRRRGIIVCFDADSRCDPNYFVEIEKYFQKYPKTPACTLYFEHPIEGHEFPPKVYQAISAYELHLRYFIHAQKYAAFPFATQTVGSSMAVRSDIYQKQGGMNRRKAGEDFYFLHKFSSLPYFGAINSTRVIPSPRKSDRVPFGTGKAVKEIIGKSGAFNTYAPGSFEDLRSFFTNVRSLFDMELEQIPEFEEQLPLSIRSFLQSVSWSQNFLEIKSNTSTRSQFVKRFFNWFDAFKIMKFVHFSRDHFHPDIGVSAAASWLLQHHHKLEIPTEATPKKLLTLYRDIDRRSATVKSKEKIS